MILYVIWKPICHFLVVINSNLDRISHRFLDMENAHFSNPRPFNPQFEHVPLK